MVVKQYSKVPPIFEFYIFLVDHVAA